MRLVACALLVACCAGACSASGGDDSAAPTTTLAPAPAPDPTCTAFHGAQGPLSSFGERPPALLVDAFVEQIGCLDRVTFEFESLGDGTPPGYTVEYRDLARDPIINAAGGVMELPAAVALVVHFTPASSVDARQFLAPSSYRGNLRLSYGATHHINIVAKQDDTADSVVWIVGLDVARPYVVDSAMGPTRASIYVG